MAWQAVFDVRLIWLYFVVLLTRYVRLQSMNLSYQYFIYIDNEIIVSIKNAGYKKEVF